CSTVCGCQSVADYRRAQEWTAAMQRWCDRNKIAAFPGLCRAHRAELLRMRGEWSAAEGQARQAVEELRRISALDTPWALHELGLVRLRAGDLDGAEEAFMEALTLGRVPQPGLALAQLARGDIAGAAASIADVLHNQREAPQSREAPFNTPLGRATLLAAQVEIATAAGDLDTAASAAQELEQTADLFATTPLRASSAWARGKVRLARGEVSEAREDFQAAVASWAQVNAPYEVARARMGLGEAYLAAGNEASALLEFRAARMAFERLGASLDEERAQAAIGEAPHSRRERKTFMFTDIVGSTNLLEVMGDEAWGHVLRWHNDTLGGLVPAHGGEVLRKLGDGLFAAFDDPAQALACGIAIQRALEQHRRSAGFAPPLRIGVHASEATEEGRDYHGKGVHEAARIAALAEGGEILASRETLTLTDEAFPAEAPRTVTLKGMAEPVEVVSIPWH
ncbi:MAG: hypothetical protein M3252_05595, partial [Actinomycetota bacterium]|nr:hypothetical protein [Actinomycetota bacterium]